LPCKNVNSAGEKKGISLTIREKANNNKALGGIHHDIVGRNLISQTGKCIATSEIPSRPGTGKGNPSLVSKEIREGKGDTPRGDKVSYEVNSGTSRGKKQKGLCGREKKGPLVSSEDRLLAHESF